MKNLLKMLPGFGGGAKPVAAQPGLHLAAFGKHPGWDDHLPGIGLDTASLAHLKQSFYVTGIGGQIDSGAWEKLEAGKRVEGFDHTFLWARDGHLLLGRMWSSTDRKGRAKYPMILCADSTGLSAPYLFANVRRDLERLRSNCLAAATAEALETVCRSAQADLQSRIEFARVDGADAVSEAQRRRFLEHPQFGGRQEGLLRILHELGGLQPQAKAKKTSANAPARHFRVPAVGRTHEEVFLLWLEFFNCVLPPSIPLLLIWRDGAEWLDVTAGEPAGEDFFCLQAAPLAVPLSTEIPYELEPELEGRLRELTTKFLGTSTLPSHQSAASTPPPADSQENSGGRLPWVLLLLMVVVALVGGWFFFHLRRPKLAGANSPGTNSPVLTSAPAPPIPPPPEPTATILPASPVPPLPPATPGPDEARQKYDAAMQQAHDALQHKQYDAAAGGANTALAAKPDDPAALDLLHLAQRQLADQTETRKLEQNYQAALADGRKAIADLNFPLAIEKANAALDLKPGDPDAKQLAAEAAAQQAAMLAKQQQAQVYQTALADGRQALALSNFSLAIEKYNLALAIRPGDEAALGGQRQAQASLKAQDSARQQQQLFDAAFLAGQAAYERQDYTAAASNAAVALDYAPESEAAHRLRANARRQLTYAAAVSAAQAALSQGDDAEALKQAAAALAANPTGTAALNLQTEAAGGKDWQQLKILTNQTDYAAALALCDQHTNDQKFVQLAAQLRQTEAQALDEQLEVYEVWFGLLSPSGAKSARAKLPAQKKMAQDLDSANFSVENFRYYTALVDQVEVRLKALQQLDAPRTEAIAKLKKTINQHL